MFTTTSPSFWGGCLAVVVALGLLGACNPTPPQPTSAADVATAPGNVSDLDVTTAVKTALQRDDALKAFDIQVITTKGDVRLTGSVQTQAQISNAIAVAREAPGVHAVHDELTLKP
jgi:hyperosmotically inducible periplasmic protein